MIEAILGFLKALLPLIKFWKKNKAGDVIVKTAEVYDAMAHIADVSEGDIGRILILYAHNGGFDLQTGKPSYVTCLHEVIREPFFSVKGDYHKLPLDGSYNDLLRNLYLKGSVDVRAKELENGSLLSTIYQRESIDHSRIYFLKHTKEAFWFISVSTHKPEADFNNPDIAFELTRAISIIKQRI